MSLGKVARKLKRVGKTAVQFRFTSTFEYIDLSVKGSWRPDNLRIVWLRNHRKVKSQDVQWIPKEDRGPKGAEGRASFDPIISVALIVTLYREHGQVSFQEKEYKYYLENHGPNGKKILASFHCNMSDYAGIPTAEHSLDMNFNSVSVKVQQASLGITLKSEFIKQGSAVDDDMQSTFSAMSAGTDASHRDDDTDEEEEEMQRLSIVQEDVDAAQLRKSSEASKTDDAVPVRKGVQSQDEYRPPPNPYLDDSSEIEESMEPPSPTASWLGEKALFVDCFGEAVGREKLDRAEIIALYFSASWCPPCRRFLPKLVKFYHHVKQHAKSFEILYISSDYSRQDMMKYMQQQQMPWVGLSFEGKQSQDLQKFFKVMAIPQLRVVTTKGELIEESAKKPVEATSSGSDVLRLYNKWYEKVEPTEGTKEKGLFQKVKKAIKDRTGSSHDMADTGTSLSKSKEDLTGTRHVVVQNRAARGRSTLSTKNKTKEVLLEEKEERVRHLEEVNMALKQTNDDLNEEVADLKKQLAELQTRMDQTEQTSMQLEKDKRETVAKLSTRGWLCKRGVKGPTANVWRRRYFRCDQGSKVFYYKNASEGTPQGFIDLTKLISLQEVSPAQQDKNNATFLVQCDGRTYQLQALDEANMRKWMSAIEYLANWHRTNTLQNGATP
ncbi:uncharacterized protein LOC135339010 isoform X2 [Halichondria panicea]|uniref:uncharacterized protein LOC135339010 isoform X2 n=1 Tax=Halichondria panicea TaxID=6063 RepID=UPI00312BA7AA